MVNEIIKQIQNSVLVSVQLLTINYALRYCIQTSEMVVACGVYVVLGWLPGINTRLRIFLEGLWCNYRHYCIIADLAFFVVVYNLDGLVSCLHTHTTLQFNSLHINCVVETTRVEFSRILVFSLRCTTLYYLVLPCTTLHYLTLPYTTLCSTLHDAKLRCC